MADFCKHGDAHKQYQAILTSSAITNFCKKLDKTLEVDSQ